MSESDGMAIREERRGAQQQATTQLKEQCSFACLVAKAGGVRKQRRQANSSYIHSELSARKSKPPPNLQQQITPILFLLFFNSPLRRCSQSCYCASCGVRVDMRQGSAKTTVSPQRVSCAAPMQLTLLIHSSSHSLPFPSPFSCSSLMPQR